MQRIRICSARIGAALPKGHFAFAPEGFIIGVMLRTAERLPLGPIDCVVLSTRGLYLTALPPGSQFVPTLVRMKKKALGPDLLRTVEADPDRPQRMLRDFAGKSGITYVEVLEEFRKLAEEGVQLRHPNDGHLNERGTSELARILVDAIRDEF